MDDIIGALVSVGYGKETTRGTHVPATRWIGKYELSFFPRADKIMNESSYNHLAKNSGQATLRKYGEGDITAKIFDAAIVDFLVMVGGQAPTTAAVASQAGAYDHTGALLNTNTHPSYTLAVKEGGLADQRFPGAMLNSLSLEFATDDYAKMTANFLSEEPVTVANTPAHTQEIEFVPSDAHVYIVAKGGDLNAATEIADVRRASIEFNKNLIRKETLGNKKINPRNGRMEISGEIELFYNSQTFKDYWKNDTELALRLKLEATDATIGVSTHPFVQIDLPFMMIENWEPDYGADDLIPQTLSINGYLDANTGQFFSYKVRNTTASYA